MFGGIERDADQLIKDTDVLGWACSPAEFPKEDIREYIIAKG